LSKCAPAGSLFSFSLHLLLALSNCVLNPGRYYVSATGHTPNGHEFKSELAMVDVAGSNVDQVELKVFSGRFDYWTPAVRRRKGEADRAPVQSSGAPPGFSSCTGTPLRRARCHVDARG
jgi:hypothetical protein